MKRKLKLLGMALLALSLQGSLFGISDSDIVSEENKLSEVSDKQSRYHMHQAPARGNRFQSRDHKKSEAPANDVNSAWTGAGRENVNYWNWNSQSGSRQWEKRGHVSGVDRRTFRNGIKEYKSGHPNYHWNLGNTDHLVKVQKKVPAEAGIGQEFEWNYTVTPNDDVANVVVTDYIPEGIEYVSSEPQAEVQGDKLVWTFDELDQGAVQNIKAIVRARSEGTHVSCFTVDALPRVCVATFVGAPQIAIQKTGPETAMLGDNVTYNIVVTNTGTMDAKDVVLTDNVPAGLRHSTGQSTLSYELGTIAAGDSRSVPVSFTAAQTGRHCNVANAASSNAGEVSDDACTVVVEPGLQITKEGTPGPIRVNKVADYRIVATNTGDIPLDNVRVTDTPSAQTQLVSAPGAQIAGNGASWTIARLEPGQSQTFEAQVRSRVGGTYCNRVSIAGPYGLADSAEACTEWVGVPAILLEMIDTNDALEIGDSTTYVISVTNQGTAPDTNVTVNVEFPAGIDPVAVNGATNGQISGKSVSFAPYPSLAPKQRIEFRIPAKATAEGDNRVKVKLTADILNKAVIEDESTTVY